jgi:hypothetical protein
VVPEVTGLLIPPGYPEAICESVLKLLRDPERRRRMGQAAQAWVVEHYVNGRVLGLTAAYYKGLLKQGTTGKRIPRNQGIGRVSAEAGSSPGCEAGALSV